MATDDDRTFFELMLSGNRNEAVRYASRLFEQRGARHLYEAVIEPALREIGQRWEERRHTVADEHLAFDPVLAGPGGAFLELADADMIATDIDLVSAHATATPFNDAAEMKALARVMKPDGYNIGVNLGKCAGAGILEHLHIHIVPRWNGDTNFMPVIAGTGVVPQALSDLAAQLRAALAQ